jgi:leucyl/phenylalanyl-tRNA--protein transferase
MALEIVFPDPSLAENDGPIAVGGSLSVEFLTAAYSQGLFPWFNEGEPILWWSPNPRMVLFPCDFKCSKSLLQNVHRSKLEVKSDECFEDVIRNCACVRRKGQKGTWITNEMIQAYTNLHNAGYAHSVEVYHNSDLIGGLYGVSLGKAFFGESMFHLIKDASKVSLFYLSKLMLAWDYHFIDVQQSTSHLRSLGAIDVPRTEFLHMLRKSLEYPTRVGKWKIDFNNLQPKEFSLHQRTSQ